MNQTDNLENLKEINEIFVNNGNKCFIMAGTLLGYTRENKFISHDHDVDVGTMFEGFNKNIIKQMIQQEWTLKNIFGYPYDSMLFQWQKRNSTLDMYFYYNNEDKFYHSCYGPCYVSETNTTEYIQRYDYYYKKFDLKKVEFLKNEFYAPEDDTTFLEEMYGSNWRITNKNWDYTKDPKNIVDRKTTFNKIDQKKEIKKWFKEK